MENEYDKIPSYGVRQMTIDECLATFELTEEEKQHLLALKKDLSTVEQSAGLKIPIEWRIPLSLNNVNAKGAKKIIDDYQKVFDLYGKTHTIEKIMGTEVDLRNLTDNQSVCYGDGETYHWLLTKKEL